MKVEDIIEQATLDSIHEAALTIVHENDEASAEELRLLCRTAARRLRLTNLERAYMQRFIREELTLSH